MFLGDDRLDITTEKYIVPKIAVGITTIWYTKVTPKLPDQLSCTSTGGYNQITVDEEVTLSKIVPHCRNCNLGWRVDKSKSYGL